MHVMLPLNLQEEHVKEVLDELRVLYRPHEVFPVGNRSIVVDFFLPDQNVVIECWLSRSRRGAALSWVERNAAYVDLKFGRLKQNYPARMCLGLVQVPQVDRASVVEVVAAVMSHADFMTYSLEELHNALTSIIDEGSSSGPRIEGV